MNFSNENVNVIVIGDLMIDIYHKSEIKRNSPEDIKIPIHNIIDNVYKLGGACNVAFNLHSLGSSVELLGVVGDDIYGNQIEKMVCDSNLKHKLFIDKTRKTTQKNRIFYNDELKCRFDVENTHDIPLTIQDEILNHIKSSQNIRAIIISDYDKGVVTTELCQSIIAYSNCNDILTFIDPKLNNYHKYKNCFLFKPNVFEAEKITNETNIDKMITKIHNEIKCKNVLITLGEQGMIFSQNDNLINKTYKIRHKEIIHKKDVTGAGDIVLSVLVHVYIKSNNLLESCHVANYIAGKSVGVIGNYNVSQLDIDEYYKMMHYENKDNINNNKILYDYEYDKIIEISSMKNIVFTNGCFDILHSGHIKCLQFCKNQGDILVVGLNSDDSIKKIKGPERPINNIEERSTMLSLFDFIDYIIIFSQDTPYNILKLLKPLKMVKGSDYNIENIIGSEFANDVLLFNYIENKSSTSIIDKIKNKSKNVKM
jgi:D-beta-D-heptose 7-phosphate kinase/D-beta-D-heptose 1-phosphate adenosyltransferase